MRFMQKMSTFRKDLILLSFVLSGFFLFALGNHPYYIPSEARYVEGARQMVETGDWTTPRLNGVKFLDKPPITYWMSATSIKLFGLNEFSARLPIALSILGICLLIFAAGYKYYGRVSGIMAACVMASSFIGFVFSRVVLTDIPLSLFLTAGLFSFMFAMRSLDKRQRDVFLILTYICVALATLSKGLIGILIPALVIGTWIILTRQWKLLMQVRLIIGSLIFLAITVPWHILVGLETEEFYRFYFINQHLERFLTDIHHRSKWFGFFFIVLPIAFLPWTVFLFQAVREKLKNIWAKRDEQNLELYLLLWIVMPFLFFNFSTSKHSYYLLPIIPPLALWVGNYLAQIWHYGSSKGFRLGVYYGAAILFFLAVPAYFISQRVDEKLYKILSLSEEAFIGLGFATALIAISLCFMLLRQMNHRIILTSLFGFFMLWTASVSYIMFPLITSQKSRKPFAEFLSSRLKPGDEIVSCYIPANDFSIYLNRNITVVKVYKEMTFGVKIEKRVRNWMIDNDMLIKRWKESDHRIYVLLERKRYWHKLCAELCSPNIVLMQKDRYTLISNK